MARIYKESRYVLQLLIGKSYVAQYDDVKISFYTKNPNNQVMVDNGITIKRNIAEVKIESTLFDNLEEGLISYIVYGTKDGIPFIEERQSNYFLKAPLDFKPGEGGSCNLENKSVTPSMGDRNVDGYIIVEEDEGYDGLSRVVIDPQTLYNEGIEAGYDQGKTDGVNEQKLKLETINITENGTYTKEDGYNHIEVNVTDLNGSYDEGYGQGQADVAASARVLTVTENGVYKTKFSDPIMPTLVTGVYADGTEFYSYAETEYNKYNTGIKVSENTKLEIWYKPRDLGFVHNGGLIGTIIDDYHKTFSLHTEIGPGFVGEKIGRSEGNYNPKDRNKWFHIELSLAEGFIIDGVNYGTYQDIDTEILGKDIYINKYEGSAGGYFGMIKINDVVIIPTANGFKNVNTGELLEVLQDGSYTFTENLPIYGEGELYKTINVNVPDLNGSYEQGKTDGVNEQKGKLESINITENGVYSKEDGYNHIDVNVLPKINLQKTGLKLSYSTFTEVPEWVDFDGVTDMSNMFSYCFSLQTIPHIDTSNVSKVRGMFSFCSNLKTLPNNFNLGACNDMYGCFSNTSITDYSFLETWVINPNANMDAMINNTNTTYLPAIPCVGDATYQQSAIFWTTDNYSKLTYFGGWIGRKYNVNKDNILKKMPNLTYESCISILNNLYDFTGNGETPNSEQGQLKVHQNFLDKVGNEISIGTSRGWTITA